jgi:hypothetical protein
VALFFLRDGVKMPKLSFLTDIRPAFPSYSFKGLKKLCHTNHLCKNLGNLGGFGYGSYLYFPNK